mgnify:CR=1 FL=1
MVIFIFVLRLRLSFWVSQFLNCQSYLFPFSLMLHFLYSLKANRVWRGYGSLLDQYSKITK